MSLNKSVIFETTFTRYTGTDIIGEGGAGRIYQAIDDADNVYAIKLLDAAKANNEKTKRFKNEVLFSLRNQHQNIITIIDHGVFINGNKRSPFYVMPLYKGSLRTLLDTHIQPDRVLFYFAQLLDGVEAAHLQKVIHRDLKPENVLYDAEQDRLLVADFGIARFEEELLYTNVKTLPDRRLANFQYAAPEQRNRGANVDHRADIYALGLMLNEMFTGTIPQGTGYKTISSVAPDYGYLDEMVSRMLYQSAEERPASIERVKQPLIDRKIEVVKYQYFNEIKQSVVPVTSLDNPLIISPPRLNVSTAKVSSYFDVCVVCGLAEEAKAFIRVAEQYYGGKFTQGLSNRSSGRYFHTTIQNKQGKPFTIHVSWPHNHGPIEMALYLKSILDEFRPHFVVMTGICAGDKVKVRLGDLVVAEQAFSLDSGKIVIDVDGHTKHLYNTVTYNCSHGVLQFARMFDSWGSDIAKIWQPMSRRQQREWLLNHLLGIETLLVDDIPLPTLEAQAPDWRRIVSELQAGPVPYLTMKRTLRDKSEITRLKYGPETFPFKDPMPICHIAPMASSGIIRSDDPFYTIQNAIRGTIAIDMECATFYRVMTEFNDMQALSVKGVTDYANSEKDDTYHGYAAEASSVYALSFMKEYITSDHLLSRNN